MKQKLKGLIRGFLAQSQIHIMQMWKWKQNEDGGKEFGDEHGAQEWSEKASVCVCVRDRCGSPKLSIG